MRTRSMIQERTIDMLRYQHITGLSPDVGNSWEEKECMEYQKHANG